MTASCQGHAEPPAWAPAGKTKAGAEASCAQRCSCTLGKEILQQRGKGDRNVKETGEKTLLSTGIIAHLFLISKRKCVCWLIYNKAFHPLQQSKPPVTTAGQAASPSPKSCTWSWAKGEKQKRGFRKSLPVCILCEIPSKPAAQLRLCFQPWSWEIRDSS